MLGQRVREARKRAGLLQVDLAAALGDRYTHTDISRVESGQRGLRLNGLANAAKELCVSADYLLGLTDDPTPAAQRLGAEAQGPINSIAETPAGYNPSAHAASDRRPVEVLEVASAAGVGAEVFDETPVGLLWFRNDWLDSHAIDPKQCNIISVQGDSMAPALPDGCSILVDRKRGEPHEGRIYVMRTDEGLVVKRLGKDEKGRWLVISDNPDWPPAPLLYGTDIIGEVRWLGRTF